MTPAELLPQVYDELRKLAAARRPASNCRRLPRRCPTPNYSPSTKPSRDSPRSKPEHAKLLKLRYVAGLTGEEAAAVLGLSAVTADRMTRYAKAWLAVELSK